MIRLNDLFKALVCICLGAFLLIFGRTLVHSEEEPVKLEPIEIIGVTPVHGVGLPKDKIPANIQTATSTEVEAAQSLDLAEFINRNLGSVHINEAQNNPVQPDVRFRGFTASPLLGLPQGLATYQDGTRVNELFGDTVNWDVIPQSAIASINLMSGSNPLFGLNTLGGALSLKTKTGFTHPGHEVKAYGGSFTRRAVEFSSGGHNEKLSYFLSGNLFKEDGWRDFSPSDVRQLFGNVGWQEDVTTLNLSLTLADNKLLGNGALPIQLLNTERSAVFTHPDRTENNMLMANLRGSHAWSDNVMLASTVYYRRNNVETFNGDDTDFESCEDPENEGFLCVEDDADEERVKDQFGNYVRLTEEDHNHDDEETEINGDNDAETEIGDDDDEGGFNATNNTSQTRQGGYGATLQAIFSNPVASRENQFIVGASLDRGGALFNSQTELASLTPDRGTLGTGIFESESFVDVETTVQNVGIYATNTFSITPRIHFTLSGRYNMTEIILRDQIGVELNGDHTFGRLNPAAGLTYQVHNLLSFYGSYSEASRVPTPVELTCADPEAPCKLPNAFVADPPLDQVVTKTWEAGLRGELGSIAWNADFFSATSFDDLIFISSGALTNEGYFQNVARTLRQGIELNISGSLFNRLHGMLNYTYISATFETDLTLSSPNHPETRAGEIDVEIGDHIPGVPQHNLKADIAFAVTDALSLGANVLINSSQVFRGDEGNLIDQIPGYSIVNLRGRYMLWNNLSIFAKVHNLFDEAYETFGLFGEADEVLGDEFEDSRFLSPGAPRAAWVGLELIF